MGRIDVGKECREFRAELQREGILDSIKQLYRPSLGAVLAQLVLVGALVAGAVALVLKGSLLFLPLSVIVIASRQRALKNFLHDATHRNLSTSRSVNDALGRYLLAPLCGEDFALYRDRHLRHHAHLGSELDPDLPPFEVRSCAAQGPWALYARLLLNWPMWRMSVCESLPSLQGRARRFLLAWWAALALALGLLGGGATLAAFLGLWVLSKATVYHGVQAFTELCDHARLRPASILAYTRNMPAGPLSIVLHPHNDNYHLTHHLLPSIPMQNLAKAHRRMLRNARYAGGVHCLSYFFGARSVVATWAVGRAAPAPTAPAPARIDGLWGAA